MKLSRHIRSLSALTLAALLLASLPACKSDPTDDPVTDSTSTSGTATDPATDTPDTDEPTTPEETTAEPDIPTEPDATLTADNAVIVLSPYAAEWEQEAAEALAEELGLTTVSDAEVPADKALLVIGYTKLNGQFEADFDAIGDLGYMLTAKDGSVLLAANTEAGMADALAALREALTADQTVPAATHAIVKLESEAEEAPVLSGEWAENIAYANEIKNGVSTHFLDIRRYTWRLSNQNVTLTYEMKKQNTFTSITNANGIPYVINTGDVYLEKADGTRLLSADSKTAGRTNGYQIGYYYYNSHILDQNFGIRNDAEGLGNFSIDRTFHMYADKLNLVQHLVTTGGDATGVAGYGQMYEIDAERVLSLVVKDASGTHDTLEGVDWATCEYAAFDIERAGVMGFILLPYEANEGTLTVTLSDGMYVVDQHIESDATTVYAQNTHIYFGLRLYTDDGHSFEPFLHEAEAERNPLTTLSISKRIDGSAYAGYDALRGAYCFTVNGGDFSNNYYNNPSQYFTVNASIQSDDLDRTIYVYTHTGSGCLECAVILDENQTLLPIPLEVGKNFTGENEDSLYLPGDTSYGEVFFPITLKANETKNFTVLNLYQNWGQYPLKQLSSIQFVAPYYHLSTGVTETNCIAPSFVFGKDNWLLPDFRAMSAPLWSSQPQHTAIGHLYIVRYDTGDKSTGNLENCGDVIDSSGPVYADATINYLSQDGRLSATYRHVEMPQTDENRTYYTLDIEILEDIPFDDLRDDFSLFCFDGRVTRFNKLGYLDENNQSQVETLNITEAGTYERFIKLGSEYPYFDYYEPTDTTDAVNFALIIKSWDIVIGGEPYTGSFILKDCYENGLNYGYLTLDLGEVTLKAGDYIHVDYVLLPWGYSDSTDDSNVLNVRNDSCINPYTVTTEIGSVVADTYVPKVRVNEEQTAVFTLTGGDNNAVVRVYGLTSYERPVIEELVNGEWVTYDDSTNKEYDGYMIYYDEDGTYSVAFVVDMTDATAGRTLRVIEQ